MAHNATRFFQQQDHRDMERRKLSAARRAVGTFRRDGDPSGFPDLETWLNRHGIELISYDLSGFGQDDKWQLTKQEYDAMEVAYGSLLVATISEAND